MDDLARSLAESLSSISRCKFLFQLTFGFFLCSVFETKAPRSRLKELNIYDIVLILPSNTNTDAFTSELGFGAEKNTHFPTSFYIGENKRQNYTSLVSNITPFCEKIIWTSFPDVE